MIQQSYFWGYIWRKLIQKDTCTLMFIAARFTMATTWKQPTSTDRGMNEEDMDKIAEAISIVIKGKGERNEEAKAIIKELTEKYPLI